MHLGLYSFSHPRKWTYWCKEDTFDERISVDHELYFTLFSWATIITLIITSKNHELIFPICTSDQVSAWLGYCHAPKKVTMFSAIQIKKPINKNARIIGILKSLSNKWKVTIVRKKMINSRHLRIQRIS